MGLGCNSSSRRVPKDKRRVRGELRDDVIIDILSCLPAECVAKFRRVCKRWLALTSTPYFAQLHLKRSTATTTLLLQTVPRCYFPENTLELFQLDEHNTSPAGINKKTKMKKLRPGLIGVPEYNFQIRASCDGFVVFQDVVSVSRFVVSNVVTRERVTVRAPVSCPSPKSSVHALFLHPVTKEYTMLYQNPTKRHNYYLYGFTSKSWRQISSFHRVPKNVTPAVVINNRLHWVMNATWDCETRIFIFNTITEEFRLMPQPGNSCSRKEDRRECVAAVAEGSSTLCLCWVKDTVVEIWVLGDYDKWSWTKKNISYTGGVFRFLWPLYAYKQKLAFPLLRELLDINLHRPNQEMEAGTMDLLMMKIAQDDTLVMFPWTASFVSLNAFKER